MIAMKATAAGIRELIAARGAQLLYLPPYSPDLNPIEKAWSRAEPQLLYAGVGEKG